MAAEQLLPAGEEMPTWMSALLMDTDGRSPFSIVARLPSARLPVARWLRNLAAKTMTHTPEWIRQRVDALGPWFHNIDLAGVPTAPDHFLGDYPAIKWRKLEPWISADLSGKSVLDI